MREIKFRVWDKALNCWYHSPQLVIRPYSGKVSDGSTVPNVELMQYTGLKDKNGKEIYEGDIVELQMYDDGFSPADIPCLQVRGNFEVYYDNNEGLYSLKNKKEDWTPNQIGCFPSLKVIGNIHEHYYILTNGDNNAEGS